MSLAAVRSIDTAPSKKREKTTFEGLSFCPYKRSQQYQKLDAEDHQELYKIMTGKYDNKDDD